MNNQYGCKYCVNDVWRGGERVCTIRPHDCQTPFQKAIVGWLVRVPQPHEGYGCPGFKHFNPKETF